MAADCSIEACGRAARRAGLCGMHSARLYRGMPLNAPPRHLPFWSRVDSSGGLDSCWEWQGARDPRGYGRISMQTYGQAMAHRYAWSQSAPGLEMPEAVMHECDNPPCCNPLHLTAGTRLLNNQQAWSRGLHPFGEQHGAARLTSEQVAEIRQRCAAGERQKDVAPDYGVTQSHVSRIVNHEVRRIA